MTARTPKLRSARQPARLALDRPADAESYDRLPRSSDRQRSGRMIVLHRVQPWPVYHPRARFRTLIGLEQEVHHACPTVRRADTDSEE